MLEVGCVTCECAGVSKGPYVRVRKLGEQGNECVHQVAVENDTVLTLAHQHRYKLRELGAEATPIRTRHGQRILPTVLEIEDGLSVRR